ncbi:MAG: polyphosphate kinase 2 [Reichenbachiella sp.]
MKGNRIDIKKIISTEAYNNMLELHQVELLKLQQHLIESGQRLVIIFEGRDAAGKGGTIKRFIEHLNPRVFRVIALSKPNEKEKGQWYFQRYIKHMPTKGEIVFFDRSWYNRAVVEPAMGFCTTEQYGKFMHQVNDVEKMLTETGIKIVKFWLSLDKKEQKKRFKSRTSDPLKMWKLSPVDKKAQKMWDEFTMFINAMIEKTDTKHCPWIEIDANVKKQARMEMISYVLSLYDYPGKSQEVVDMQWKAG